VDLERGKERDWTVVFGYRCKLGLSKMADGKKCPDCGTDTIMEMEEGEYMCEDCGVELKEADFKFANYKIGLVKEVEDKGKLKVCKVDVGSGDPVQIVTNAKYLEVDWKVVVATEGAMVPAGGN